MGQFLTFVLHAPFAAFGGVAVGERRVSWDRPGRSAIFGLIAAALGIDSHDEAALMRLAIGYGLAIRTDAPGRLLADYHTAQVPPAERRRGRLPTRALELVQPKLETVLTRREYRTDALHRMAVWPRAAAPRSLSEIATALRRPNYVLYAGRKACALGLPFGPVIVEADSAAEAIAKRTEAAPEPERAIAKLLRARSGEVALDADAAPQGSIARIERRRDQLASRARWQFTLRDEAILRGPTET